MADVTEQMAGLIPPIVVGGLLVGITKNMLGEPKVVKNNSGNSNKRQTGAYKQKQLINKYNGVSGKYRPF